MEKFFGPGSLLWIIGCLAFAAAAAPAPAAGDHIQRGGVDLQPDLCEIRGEGAAGNGMRVSR